MKCAECSEIEPFEDEGSVYVRPCSARLAAEMRSSGFAVEDADKNMIRVRYHTKEQLMELIALLAERDEREADRLSLRITGADGPEPVTRWVSLQQLEARFANRKLIDIIANRQFGSHLQPIEDAGGSIVGFEFLLRPGRGGVPFQPYELFEVARRTGFHSFLDRAARISAIETAAALLPVGIKRFVNFLPSSIYNPQYCLTHTFEAIERLKQNPADYVFEVVETEKIQDFSHLGRIFAEYRRQGMLVALDDVGAGYSTVEAMVKLEPDYVKIDRGLVSQCDTDGAKQEKIGEIVGRAAQFGGTVLAEGIERREEFEYCRSHGIALAQGYLFGRPEEFPPAHFRTVG